MRNVAGMIIVPFVLYAQAQTTQNMALPLNHLKIIAIWQRLGLDWLRE